MCRMLVGVSFILRLGPGPVSWEAELQLDTGQKKSVFTTPHFVLQRRSGHAGVDCQIFCEICYFQDSHTHRAESLLLSFNCGKRLHNTMSIC